MILALMNAAKLILMNESNTHMNDTVIDVMVRKLLYQFMIKDYYSFPSAPIS